MSRQLESILKRVPAATAQYSATNALTNNKDDQIHSTKEKEKEKTDRIVAVVPKKLKQEIKTYVMNNHGETERTVILRALKLLGFKVEDAWLVDNRSMR